MLVEVQGLGYRFKGEAQDALSGVSLNLMPGEVLGLIGPDGAGKTTLLRLLAGLLKPQQGRISLAGLDPLRQHAAVSAQVGYMTQGFSLYADLSLAENMRLFARLKGIEPVARAEAEAEELLRVAGLAPFRERLAGKLSGGMKQKLALICALYGNPPVLLLDEPGVGVDPVSRRELWQLVEQARAAGRGIVWSTAYLDEAARCDRVCILHEGRVRFLGTPGELLAPLRGRVFALPARPAERMPLLRRLQADPAVMDAMIEGARVRFLLRERPATPLPGAQSVEPQVEEAFISLLGGVPGHRRPPRPAVPPRGQGEAPLIVTEELTKTFGEFIATDKLSIRVHRGEIFGILGANGAGKTTAFRMMCGLIPASSGKASLLGIDLLKNAREARAHLGYMAQKFSLYGTLTVRQNLRFFASVYGLKGEKRRQRMAEVAERFELLPYMESAAGPLPLGIRQRLSMACATLHEPEFLFLDEPTSGVDPFARREFWEEINDMAAAGVSIIVTTHFMDEAQYLHRMVIMNQGRVIAEGTPEELKAAAATPHHPHPTMEDAFIHYVEQPLPPATVPSPPQKGGNA